MIQKMVVNRAIDWKDDTHKPQQEDKKMAGQGNLAAVLPLKKPGMDFGAALAATKTTESAPKKGKMPTLADAPPEVKDAVDQYQQAAQEKKTCEAVMEVSGATIIDHVRGVQDQEGFARNFHGSYAILGNTNTAKVVYANKYTLAAEDEAQLQAILGQNFGAMISKKFTVKLKDEVFTDEAKQAELMGLIGERFPEFFETKASLSVCEDFNKLVYQVLQPGDLENLRVFAKQYKPSIR